MQEGQRLSKFTIIQPSPSSSSNNYGNTRLTADRHTKTPFRTIDFLHAMTRWAKTGWNWFIRGRSPNYVNCLSGYNTYLTLPFFWTHIQHSTCQQICMPHDHSDEIKEVLSGDGIINKSRWGVIMPKPNFWSIMERPAKYKTSINILTASNRRKIRNE